LIGGSGSASSFNTRIADLRCSPLTAANSVRILTFSSRVAAAYRRRNASTSSRRAGAVIEALINHLHFVGPPEVVPSVTLIMRQHSSFGNNNFEAISGAV
jgi:hypothetical protein